MECKAGKTFSEHGVGTGSEALTDQLCQMGDKTHLISCEAS